MKKIWILYFVVTCITILINIFPRTAEDPQIERYTYRSEHQELKISSKAFNTEYQTNEEYYEHSVVPLENDELLLIESARNLSDGSIIQKFDRDMKMVWSLGGLDGIQLESKSYDVYVYNATQIKNGTIMVIGYAINDYNVRPVLLTLSPKGVLEEYMFLSDLEISVFSGLILNLVRTDVRYDIVSTPDGGYTLILDYKSSYTTHLVHLNEKGNVIWNKSYTLNVVSPRKFTQSSKVVLDSSGNYYLWKESNKDEKNSHTLLKLSDVGELIWEKELNYNIERVKIIKGDRLIIVGSSIREQIARNELHYFIRLKNINKDYRLCSSNLTCDGYYGGEEFIITQELNVKDGDLIWDDEVDYPDFNRITITEGDHGDFYIIMWYDNIEGIIKYTNTGERIGDLFSMIYNVDSEYRIPDQGPNVIYRGDELLIIDFLYAPRTYTYERDPSQSYHYLNLNHVKFNKQEFHDYEAIKFYQNVLYVRVLLNNLFIIGVMAVVGRIIHRRIKKHREFLLHQESLRERFVEKRVEEINKD